MLAKLYSVDEVKLSIQKINPPNLVVRADGKSNSTGWSDQQLLPYVYISPPADGIYEFDLVGTPPGPETIVNRVISDMNPEAELVWEGFPSDLKGVRVYASYNSLTTFLNSGSSQTVALKGTLTDEGVECQAFRTSDGDLYTLVGDLRDHKSGDEVTLTGQVVDFSFCMQGTTISVTWIGKA